jgi:hypothetical protein
MYCRLHNGFLAPLHCQIVQVKDEGRESKDQHGHYRKNHRVLGFVGGLHCLGWVHCNGERTVFRIKRRARVHGLALRVECQLVQFLSNRHVIVLVAMVIARAEITNIGAIDFVRELIRTSILKHHQNAICTVRQYVLQGWERKASVSGRSATLADASIVALLRRIVLQYTDATIRPTTE